VANSFHDLIFTPRIDEMIPSDTRGRVNVLTGTNNSGKSAYLKQAVDQPGKLYIGVNRFYSFHHLQLYNDNRNEVNEFYNNLQNTKHQPFQNFEGSFFNASSALVRLTNDRRKVLFETFTELFGLPIEVRAETPNNDFSNKYVSVAGDSLSVTSSGTRLFLGILAAIMDERFHAVAIDEPELGLSPPLQRKLSDIIMKGEFHERLFPHKPSIILTTHSHLFLDKATPTNNWVVSKDGVNITAKRCEGFSELHDIQLRLLGNDLGDLFLPHAVLFVEGETDKLYLEQVFKRLLPRSKLVIQDCGGDIAQRLNFWAQALGDIQTSPYRQRTFAIYDKVEQAGLDRVCSRLGLPEANKVKWSGNGIEFLYPISIMREIYRSHEFQYSQMEISGDYVSFGGLSYKKMELCRLVCDRLTEDTEYPEELDAKLIAVLRSLEG
jgi:Predicted ATP-dependent endonuclease of the OLD family